MDGRARGYQQHVPAGCLHREGAGHGDADANADSETYPNSAISPYSGTAPVDTVVLEPMRRRITNETWEQIKTGYAARINLREIARKMNVPEGTVLAHAKRHGWTQQIQRARRQLRYHEGVFPEIEETLKREVREDIRSQKR
jgi:hypothetical protein